jgi:hypothetical protein
MMDLLKDPDSRKPHADSILRQLPKRIGTGLDLDEAVMMEAWGIFYREDWDCQSINQSINQHSINLLQPN